MKNYFTSAIRALTAQKLTTFFVCRGNKVKYLAFASPNNQRFFLLGQSVASMGSNRMKYRIGELTYHCMDPSRFMVAYDPFASDLSPASLNDFFRRNRKYNRQCATMQQLDWSDIPDDAHYRAAFNDWLHQNGYRLICIRRV